MRQVLFGAALALLVGVGGGYWLRGQTNAVPDAMFCEVSEESAASRLLPAGALIDGTDSGCAPLERRLCVAVDGAVVTLEEC